MCRLLGINANKPVDLEFSLEKFKKFSNYNPDGWGLGWYENDQSKVYKQGISASDVHSKFPDLSKRVRSKIIIVHVRKGTGASPSEFNSHPFKHNNWLFAHNGSVDRDYLISLLKTEYKEHLKGETDSEAYFYFILQNIKEKGSVKEGITQAIGQAKKREYSGLNFLLSDGISLYAFRYSNRRKHYYSLYNLERDPSKSGSLEFVSQETQAVLRSKSLKNEKASLVCSEKLTEEEWEDIETGKLLKIHSDLSKEEEKIL